MPSRSLGPCSQEPWAETQTKETNYARSAASYLSYPGSEARADNPLTLRRQPAVDRTHARMRWQWQWRGSGGEGKTIAPAPMRWVVSTRAHARRRRVRPWWYDCVVRGGLPWWGIVRGRRRRRRRRRHLAAVADPRAKLNFVGCGRTGRGSGERGEPAVQRPFQRCARA